MNIDAVRAYLASPSVRKPGPCDPDYFARLAELKREAVANRDQTEAKAIWCLEQTLKTQEAYRDALAKLRDGQFYKGWCALERAEIELHFIESHKTRDWTSFKLDVIEEQVPKWQGLFPYRLFMSPEIVHVERRCSICDRVVLLRNPCGHRVGEIYDGEMCGHTITKVKLVGSALTDHPVQKYSVMFPTDPVTGGHMDNYDYALVEYAIRAIKSDFDRWDVQRVTKRQPHYLFNHVGRNDPCPCDSGVKYKKCCLNEVGVLRPHVQFTFEQQPAADVPSEVFLDGGRMRIVQRDERA